MVASEQWERNNKGKKNEKRDIGVSEHTGRLEESNGENDEAADARGGTVALNYPQDGQNARSIRSA